MVIRIVGLILISVVLFMTFRFFSLGQQSQSDAPKLGLVDGRLIDCPDKPNCVSTYATDEKHRIEPLSTALTNSQAQQKAKLVLTSLGGNLENESQGYLHFTFKSSLFGFVDDFEVQIVGEDAATVHMRSASRVGYSDMGANRKRAKAFVEGFQGASSGAKS